MKPALLDVAWSFMAGGARAAARCSKFYSCGAKRPAGSGPTLHSRCFARPPSLLTQEPRGMFHLVPLTSWFNMGTEGITDQFCALYRTWSLDLRSATVDPLKTQRGTPHVRSWSCETIFFRPTLAQSWVSWVMWVKMFDHSILPKRLSEKKCHSETTLERAVCTCLDGNRQCVG